MIKKPLIAFAITCLSSSLFASGVPTADLAAIEQRTHQFAQTLAQYKQQYDQMKQQYETLTGSYGRGAIGLGLAMLSSSIVPGSWQDVVQQQAKGAYGSKQAFYEKLINTLPADIFIDPKGQAASDYKMSTNSVRAAFAGGDALYAEVQTHLENLHVLAKEVDSTSNIKDAQDLQNRISAENGMLQTAMGKLNAINMNLQANMLNEKNQATAATQERFKRSAK